MPDSVTKAETCRIGDQPVALVFDSGAGGLSVAGSIAAAQLGIGLTYLADDGFFPYGDKADAVLVERVPDLIAAGVEATGAAIVVVACNTASTIALEPTRARLSVPVVGVVPAVKPAAALTRSGVIGLLGTPATVRRRYTDQLIADHATGKVVIRHGATDLAAAAEDALAGKPVDSGVYQRAIAGLFDAPGGAEMDVVVLACTHFPLVRDELIAAAAPRVASWIDSGEAIARRVGHLLGRTPGLGPTTFGMAHTTGPATPQREAVFRKAGFSGLSHFPFRAGQAAMAGG